MHFQFLIEDQSTAALIGLIMKNVIRNFIIKAFKWTLLISLVFSLLLGALFGLYFVKKDMIEKTLPRALQKAIDIVNQKRNKEYIKLVDNGKIIYVKQREIDYIEKDGRLIFFNLENERYMSYMSIKALMNNLADNFGRCQSGFVINYDHIDTVKNDKIILQSGREIPIGRAYKKEFMRNYLKYMTDRI